MNHTKVLFTCYIPEEALEELRVLTVLKGGKVLVPKIKEVVNCDEKPRRIARNDVGRI